MKLLYISSFAVISTGCFILGFYILQKDRNRIVNRLFFINSVLLNAVIFFTVLIQIQGDQYYVKLFQIFYNIVFIIFLLESLLFNLVFTKQSINSFFKIVLFLSTALVFIIFIYYGQDLITVSKSNGLWVYELVHPGFWFFLYTPLLLIIAALMIYCLYSFSRHALLNKEKLQAKSIMISIFTAFGGGFCFMMIFPVLEVYKIPLLTPYFFAVYLFGVFYAMNRYRFLSFCISDLSSEVLSYIQDIVIMLSPDKIIMDSNGNLSQLLSVNPDSLQGKNIMDIVENDACFADMLNQLIEGRINSFISRIVYKNEPENRITDSSVLRIQDKFGDFSAILIVSRENKGISQFRKHFKITAREMDIIDNAVAGLTNKAISEKLNITERTVEAHLNNIYNKLGINNKVELLRITGEFSLSRAN